MNQPARQRTETGSDLVHFDPLSKSTPPPWLKPLIGALGKENGKPVLMRNRVIKPDQQIWISARLKQLEEALHTDTNEDHARAISLTKLQSVLGNPASPKSFAEIRAEVYLAAIVDIPAWAFEAAVMRWIKGEELFEHDNPVFVPRPAQLIRLANIHLKPLEDEREKLRLLMACVTPTQIEESRWLPAFSRAWWYCFHEYVSGREGLKDRSSSESAWLRNRISLARDHTIGWKIDDPERRAIIEEAGKSFVKIDKHSAQAAAWSGYFKERGVQLPMPDHAPFIFAPTEFPPPQSADPPSLAEMDEVIG